jgi:hypothetical protein
MAYSRHSHFSIQTLTCDSYRLGSNAGGEHHYPASATRMQSSPPGFGLPNFRLTDQDETALRGTPEYKTQAFELFPNCGLD